MEGISVKHAESWKKMIEAIDKYFHTPIVNHDCDGYVIREVLISDKKSWAFDIINRVYCNYKTSEFEAHNEFFQPHSCKGMRAKYGLTDRHFNIFCEFTCQPYLNGVTRIVIKSKL